MSLRTPVGLADFAIACAKLRPNNATDLGRIARLLGLTAVGSVHLPSSSEPARVAAGDEPPIAAGDEPPISIPIDVILPVDVAVEDPEDLCDDEAEESQLQQASPLRRKLEKSRVWGSTGHPPSRFVKKAVRAEAGPMPAAVQVPAAIACADPWPMGDAHRALCVPAPLLHRGISRAFVSDIGATWVPSAEVDLHRLTESLARGRWLRRIPRIRRRRVPRSPRFLVDTSEVMVPFLEETRGIVRVAGAIWGCSTASVTWTAGCPDPAGLDETRPMPRVESGDTLIVASLLGLGGSGPVVEQWHEFARRMHLLGVRLIALTPALAAHWRRAIDRRWWRFKSLMSPGMRHRLATPQHVQKLAALLSMVVNPQPALLRALRRRHFPDVEPYLESMLVQSRWVSAAYPRRILMNASGLQALQATVGESLALLAGAREVASLGEDSRGPRSDRDALAERLWLDAVSKGRDAEERVVSTLARMVKTLHENPDDQSSARFFRTVLARLPASARDNELFPLASLLVSLGLHQQLDNEALAISDKHGGWLYPRSATVGLAWSGHKLFLRDNPRSGDALLTVPDTPRRQVWVDWSPRGQEWRCFFRGHRDSLIAPYLPVAVRNLRGQSFALSQPDETELWTKLQHSLRSQSAIYGEVVASVTRGDQLMGYLVDVGLTAFLPASQVTRDGFFPEPEAWLGQRVRVVVVSLNRARRDVTVSRAKAPDTTTDFHHKFLASLRPGQRLEGVVSRVTNNKLLIRFGASVADVRMEDLPEESAVALNDHAAVDQKLACVVVSVDLATSRLKLSLRDVPPDPWLSVASRYPVGSVVKGRARSVSHSGAFVELEPGVDAYLRNSDIDVGREISSVERVLTEGQEIEVIVGSVDVAQRRIGLSIKQLVPD